MQTTEQKSTKIEDGGPAFPHCFEDVSGHPSWRQSQGMSMRDWFAGQALVGLIQGYAVAYGSPTCAVDEVVSEAFGYADAMLAAIAKAEGR